MTSSARQPQNQEDLQADLPGDLLLEEIELDGLAVEVVVHILLDEGGEDVDVVLQLHLPVVVAPGPLDLADLLLQVLAQVQHAGDRPEAVLLAGGAQ